MVVILTQTILQKTYIQELCYFYKNRNIAYGLGIKPKNNKLSSASSSKATSVQMRCSGPFPSRR
jgi:hypothetical protein